jgi:hypothetical protein
MSFTCLDVDNMTWKILNIQFSPASGYLSVHCFFFAIVNLTTSATAFRDLSLTHQGTQEL